MANEKRLIDVNALKREIRKMPWKVRKAETKGKEEIVAIINDAPTVDAGEVVLCKDCEFYTQEDHYCKKCSFVDEDTYQLWYPNDFCSYGRRRVKDG